LCSAKMTEHMVQVQLPQVGRTLDEVGSVR
jgi:hypothetical protein